MMRVVMVAALLAALLFLGAGSARAQGSVDEARMYFDAGSQAYELGDYDTAIRSFERAYEASPRPAIAFSLAQAYRRQYVVDGDAARLKQAVTFYRKYLDEVPQGGRREDAVTYLGELQPELLRIEAERPVPAAPSMPERTQLMVMSRVKEARASIDGEPAVPVPLTVELDPGPHHIRVEAEGHFPEEVEPLAVEGRLVVVEANPRERPASLVLQGTRGADVALDGRAIAPGAAPLVAPAGRYFLTVTRRGHRPLAREIVLTRGVTQTIDARLVPTTQRRASQVVLAGAGAALVSALTTTFLALDAEAEAQELLGRRDRANLTAAELARYGAAHDRRDDLVTVSGVLYASAAIAGTTGLLLYLLDTPAVAPAKLETPIVPSVSPEGLGLTFRGAF